MRILVAGDWHSDLHEEEVCKSLRRLGHEVSEFKWAHYFSSETLGPKSLFGLSRRFQNKFIVGPLIARLNHDFIAKVRSEQPNAIFIYRGTHFFKSTLIRIKSEFPSCKLIGYNNDDPFSPNQPWYLWRNFLAGIPHYHLMLAYRQANLLDYTRAGARKTELLRSWFVPDRNYPVVNTERKSCKYTSDVVFVGHYENDDRLSCLEALVESGISVRIFGPSNEWNPVLKKSNLLKKLLPIRLVWGKEYNQVVGNAKIALCFLSKLNRDTYTRRCFEIPASKTLLLSEYTEDLASMFKDNEEAVFFSDAADLVNKTSYLLKNQNLIEKISEAGYLRVNKDGHDIDSRMIGVINSIRQIGI